MPSKKRRQQLPLARGRVAQTPDRELIAAAQRAGDRHHALLQMRQEFPARGGALTREHRLGDRRIIQAVEPVELPAELHVRHRLDVEDQAVHRRPPARGLAFVRGLAPARGLGRDTGRPAARRTAPAGARSSTATATTSPASSVSVTWPSPMPSRCRIRSPRARVDHLRLAPGVLHHADIAHPHAVREAGAHRLDDRLLGRKAHRQEALRSLRALELHPLLGHQQPLDDARAEARVASRACAAPPARRYRCRRSCAASRRCARREHQRLHVAHRRGQPIEQRPRDDRVADVELDDLARWPPPAATLW